MYNDNVISFGLTLFIITISIVLLLSASIIITQHHQAFARCPNGFHKSPNGTCEQVTSSPKSSVSRGTINFDQNDNSAAGQSASRLSSPSSSASTSTSNNQCDQTLWKHVYNPTRLQVVDACKSVLGVIESKRVEKDGDYHIRVKLDPQFSNLINSANIKNQFGDLVVEPICVNRITQADAISACQNFHQNISILPIGSHVNITGSYVLDKEHGSWAEIHPVTSINKTP
jgi:hypothetical protein